MLLYCNRHMMKPVSFATIQRSKARWQGKRGPQRSIANNIDQVDGTLKERRDAFLKNCRKSEDDQLEMLEKRRRAAAQVRAALKAREQQQTISRPLRRFDVLLVVVVVYHQYNAKTKKETTKRMMVVMEDKMKFEKLNSWAVNVCGIDPKKKLSFEYVGFNGEPTKIDSKISFQVAMKA